MAYSMGLTAGEINDFGKWELWNDLSKGELAYYQKTWKTSLRGRLLRTTSKWGETTVGRCSRRITR